jgi:hypothetical protein
LNQETSAEKKLDTCSGWPKGMYQNRIHKIRQNLEYLIPYHCLGIQKSRLRAIKLKRRRLVDKHPYF